MHEMEPFCTPCEPAVDGQVTCRVVQSAVKASLANPSPALACLEVSRRRGISVTPNVSSAAVTTSADG